MFLFAKISYMYQHIQMYSIIILFSALFAVFGCRGNETAIKDIDVDPGVVYAIGDSYTLTFEDLHAYARNLGVHFRYEDALEGYIEVMLEMVGNQFKRFDFFDRNLQENEELMLPMRRYINEELVAAFYDQKFLGNYLTDEFLRDTHKKMQNEVIYRQIVLFEDERHSDEEKKSLENNVESIVERIKKGEDFSNLLNTYSQDQRSLRTNGYAQPAIWRRSVRNPVDSLAFRLNPGDVEVVRHNNAFYIVKVTDRNRISLSPFEEMEDDVRRQVRDAYMQRSFDEYERFLESLIDEESLQWHEEGIETFIRLAGQPGFFRDDLYRDYINQELNKGNNFVILSYADGTVNLEKLLFLLDNVLSLQASSRLTVNVIKDYLVAALREMKVGELATEAGLLEKIFNPVTDNWALSNEILIAYNNHVIENQISDPTPERLKAFFEEVKDSLFYQLRTVYTRIITADSESQVEELKSRYQAGTSFAELAHRIQVRVFYRDRDGNVHVRNNRPQPDMENIIINLEEGEVAGAVYFYHPERGRIPSLVLANRVLPEKQLSFEEVSDRIENVFREHQRAKINERTISDIRANYDYRFYEEHLIQNLRDRDLL